MIKVLRCDAYGWKYVQGEYVDQPKWFIELLREKRRIDYEYQESKNKSSTARRP